MEQPRSMEDRVLARLRRKGRGTVTTPGEFLDLGSREAVDTALHRLARKQVLRRLSRGVYDYPREHPVLGTLSPSVEAVVRALTARDHTRVQPTGAQAANLLGLSEQVPAKVVYLTDGPSKKMQVGPWMIELRQTTPRHMAAAGRLSGLLIQAFRYLGEGQVTPQQLAHLQQTLPAAERRGLLRDLELAPVWMQPLLRALAEE